jgi:hypothetical protein
MGNGLSDVCIEPRDTIISQPNRQSFAFQPLAQTQNPKMLPLVSIKHGLRGCATIASAMN